MKDADTLTPGCNINKLLTSASYAWSEMKNSIFPVDVNQINPLDTKEVK